MKRLALVLLLAFAPAAAQLDALLDAMDARAGVAAMLTQMEGTSRRLAESVLATDSRPEVRAGMERSLASSAAMMRELMDWGRLEPAYRAAYADVFTADEVEAMTRFYSTPEGRAIPRKMPEVMAHRAGAAAGDAGSHRAHGA